MQSTPLSGEVLLIGDNQTHYLYPHPFLYRSAFIDHEVVPVAIRSPEQDLFGQDLLRYAIKNWAGNAPIIHMGDALDISCTVEWAQFAALMQEATQLGPGNTRQWVMVPGNHDGYFFGNFTAPTDEKLWKQACRAYPNAQWSEVRNNKPMHKSQYLAAYLDIVGSMISSLAAARGGHPHGQWTCNAADCGKHELQAAAWNLDDKHPWRSYLVQRVNLGFGSQAILIDTSSYTYAPTLIGTHAGTTGAMSSEERAIVKSWVESAARAGKVVVIGHHQYDALDSNARGLLDSLMRETNVVLYVSAHTHEGQYFAHGGGDTGWLELNIGSILDWHPEARDLSLRAEVKPISGKILFKTNLLRISPMLADASWKQCKAAWWATPNDPDYYIHYMQLKSADPSEIENEVADSLLAAYQRLFTNFPLDAQAEGVDVAALDPKKLPTLDAKHALLLDLDQRERLWLAANTADSEHRQYRMCEAVWASSHEIRRTNAPEVFDTTIQLR